MHGEKFLRVVVVLSEIFRWVGQGTEMVVLNKLVSNIGEMRNRDGVIERTVARAQSGGLQDGQT